MQRAWAVACLLSLSGWGTVAAQGTPENVSVRLGGRLQFQFNSTSVEEADVGERIANTTFETRRARVRVSLQIGDWITGVVEPDFALGDLEITQAWMNLGIDPAFELRFGQYKKPFSLIFLTSSLDLPTIERGQRIRGLYDDLMARDNAPGLGPVLSVLRGNPLVGEEHDLLDAQGYLGYEMGVSAHGVLGAFDYDVGIFNGTGQDARDENDGKSFAGRLSWRAPSTTPIIVGASASHHEIAAGLQDVDGTAYALDLGIGEFRRTGWHILAEATTGDNLASGGSFRGAQVMASWFHALASARVEGIEPAARVSWGDPDTDVDDDDGVLLTPGVNLYFHGRNRLMLNWDVFVPAGSRFETRHALRAQAQLAW